MKSGGLWKFGFLRRRGRDTARNADASVGEWLNSVVQSSDDEGSAEASRQRRPPPEESPRRRDRSGNALPQAGDENARRGAAREEARQGLGEAHARLDQLAQELDRLSHAQAARQRAALDRRNEPVEEHKPPLTRAAPQPLRSKSEPVLSVEDAVAEIAARQRALDNETAEPAPPSVPEPVRDGIEAELGGAIEPAMPARGPAREVPTVSFAPASVPALTVDFSGLEAQLRQITARIEALQPASDIEKAIAAIRTDLADISRQLGEALPRHAVESLEIEVKALGERIDHSRQSGVDPNALAGLERGLAEVHEALRTLTPAENLVGFDEALKSLAQKVDMILARDDPSALQQLETAIGGLRGVVSHVASNDTLTKVAEDVRALASQVDSLTVNAATGQAVSALEQRVDTLAAALNASSEAGHAVPRDLEKLLGGLIEKLEWVQLTHTDHAALAHLEDRIATLVQRFDASDARLGHLEAIERGLADLLVHIDEIRGSSSSAVGTSPAPMTVHAMERDVAEIRQNDRRTQDSLEAVAGTVEQLVDRLATIESDIHRDAAPRAEPAGQMQEPEPAVAPSEGEPGDSIDVSAAPPTPESAVEEAPVPRSPPARRPIDPTLPPDHPLEPGSTAPRSRPLSAAERIAESEAAIGLAKPPVIADSERPNFIAAARRAAQAAAWEPAGQKPKGGIGAPQAPAPASKLSERLRKLIVAGSVLLILLGCLRIATRMFGESNSGAPPQTRSDQASPPAGPPQASIPPKQQPSIAPTSPSPDPAPSAQPSAAPAKTGKPDRQSRLDAGDNQTAEDAVSPSGVGLSAATATPSWATPDITGALPPLEAAPPVAPAMDHSAAIADGTLPATIGDPALRKAAMSGDPAAAYEVATRFAEGRGVLQNNEAAAYWLQRAAKQGLAPAQFRLGGLYEKGLGVKKDLATARDLYLAAAQKGNGKAMHNLAVLYAEGVDGPPDYGKAAVWFRKAADHGIRDSQYNLGILCARGIGVKQSDEESYKWFALAAKQGDQDAAKKRDEIASHLDAPSLAAARLAVQKWTPEPQPDDAINVKTAAAWDATAELSGPAKPQ
jgi:localization factor PodJL